MKEEEIKEKAKNHIESFVGYDDDGDLEMKVNLFTEGYYSALQKINKNDVIGRFDESELKTAYRIGFNHGKHCASYQGDDIVNALSKARDWNDNINWE